MQITVHSNVDAVRQRMSALQRRQLPFATSLALTQTVRDAKAVMDRKLDIVIDQPTPFTKRGIAIRAARKTMLTASVFFKDIQARYLKLQETGGIRYPRRRALVIPSERQTNKYGNLPRGRIKRLLARKDVFSGTVKGVPGIWQRMKRGGVKLLVAYEAKARYEPRLQADETIRPVLVRRFPANFFAGLRRALASAR